jgi:quercetin dioxygenase-like cupin family protein
MDVRYLSTITGFSSEKLKKNPVFQTARFFLDVYCLRVGQSQTGHVHAESDKVYVVLEGSCRFTIDGQSAVHGEGAAVLAPAGSNHGVENVGPGDARLLVLMTPPPGRQ